MIRRFVSALIVFIGCAAWAAAQEPKPAGQGGWEALFNGKSLEGWKITDFGGEGEVDVQDGVIIMRMGQPLTGITWKDGDKIPTDDFEVTLQAMKRKGDDFFCALTFPVRDSHASFVVGGWAGGLRPRLGARRAGGAAGDERGVGPQLDDAG